MKKHKVSRTVGKITVHFKRRFLTGLFLGSVLALPVVFKCLRNGGFSCGRYGLILRQIADRHCTSDFGGDIILGQFPADENIPVGISDPPRVTVSGTDIGQSKKLPQIEKLYQISVIADLRDFFMHKLLKGFLFGEKLFKSQH